MGQAKQRKQEIEALKNTGSKTALRKELGQVFTPTELVNEMLDKLDDTLFNLPINQLKWKTIFEPSCGNGQFILGIIKKLMLVYSKNKAGFGKDTKSFAYSALSHILQNQLFAVELDEIQRQECLKRLGELCTEYGCTPEQVQLLLSCTNIIQGNTLELDLYKAFSHNIKNWGPFIAQTGMQLKAAAEFKLSAISIPEMFNPAELDVLKMFFANK